MKRADRNKAYDIAIKTTGECYQVGMAIEEMSELTKELVKKSVRGKNNIPEITEEIADVMVTIEGLKRLYHIPDTAITKIMDKKIRYMLKKMEKINNGENIVYSSHDYYDDKKTNKDIPDDILNIDISKLGFSTRIINALHRMDIITLGDFKKYNYEQLALFQGIGKSALQKITNKLMEYSISL